MISTLALFIILDGAVFSSSVGAAPIDETGINTQKINKESATEPYVLGCSNQAAVAGAPLGGDSVAKEK